MNVGSYDPLSRACYLFQESKQHVGIHNFWCFDDFVNHLNLPSNNWPAFHKTSHKIFGEIVEHLGNQCKASLIYVSLLECWLDPTLVIESMVPFFDILLTAFQQNLIQFCEGYWCVYYDLAAFRLNSVFEKKPDPCFWNFPQIFLKHPQSCILIHISDLLSLYFGRTWNYR